MERDAAMRSDTVVADEDIDPPSIEKGRRRPYALADEDAGLHALEYARVQARLATLVAQLHDIAFAGHYVYIAELVAGRVARLDLRTGEILPDMIIGVPHGRTGEIRWHRVTAVPEAKDAAGRPQRAYVMFTDLTERKKAEQALQQRDQQARQALVESEARWLLAQSLDQIGRPDAAARELAKLVKSGNQDRFVQMAREKLKK